MVSVEGKDVRTIDLDKVVYDNEQAVPLFRRLPLSVGYKTKIAFFTSFGYTSVPVGLEVTEREEVQVPAGKFDCFKIDLSIHQSFWISADEHRQMVKFEASGMTAELTGTRQREPDGTNVYRDKPRGVSLAAPADWIFWQARGDPEAKVFILDPSVESVCELEIESRQQLELDDKSTPRQWAEKEVAKASETFKDFKVRTHCWRDTTVAGMPAVTLIGDYVKGNKRKSLFGVLALGKDLGVKFAVSTSRDKLEQARGNAETILETLEIEQQ